MLYRRSEFCCPPLEMLLLCSVILTIFERKITRESFKETLVVCSCECELDAVTMQIVIKIVLMSIMGKCNIDRRLVSMCQ